MTMFTQIASNRSDKNENQTAYVPRPTRYLIPNGHRISSPHLCAKTEKRNFARMKTAFFPCAARSTSAGNTVSLCIAFRFVEQIKVEKGREQWQRAAPRSRYALLSVSFSVRNPAPGFHSVGTDGYDGTKLSSFTSQYREHTLTHGRSHEKMRSGALAENLEGAHISFWSIEWKMYSFFVILPLPLHSPLPGCIRSAPGGKRLCAYKLNADYALADMCVCFLWHAQRNPVKSYSQLSSISIVFHSSSTRASPSRSRAHRALLSIAAVISLHIFSLAKRTSASVVTVFRTITPCAICFSHCSMPSR